MESLTLFFVIKWEDKRLILSSSNFNTKGFIKKTKTGQICGHVDLQKEVGPHLSPLCTVWVTSVLTLIVGVTLPIPVPFNLGLSVNGITLWGPSTIDNHSHRNRSRLYFTRVSIVKIYKSSSKFRTNEKTIRLFPNPSWIFLSISPIQVTTV